MASGSVSLCLRFLGWSWASWVPLWLPWAVVSLWTSTGGVAGSGVAVGSSSLGRLLGRSLEETNAAESVRLRFGYIVSLRICRSSGEERG